MPKADQKAAHRKSDRHRVVELKVEEDGDLHIALHDATGDKPGVVVCEIPAQPLRGASAERYFGNFASFFL